MHPRHPRMGCAHTQQESEADYFGSDHYSRAGMERQPTYEIIREITAKITPGREIKPIEEIVMGDPVRSAHFSFASNAGNRRSGDDSWFLSPTRC